MHVCACAVYPCLRNAKHNVLPSTVWPQWIYWKTTGKLFQNGRASVVISCKTETEEWLSASAILPKFQQKRSMRSTSLGDVVPGNDRHAVTPEWSYFLLWGCRYWLLCPCCLQPCTYTPPRPPGRSPAGKGSMSLLFQYTDSPHSPGASLPQTTRWLLALAPQWS